MPKPTLRLHFREPEIDTNRPFVEGAVQVEGFDLDIGDYRGPDSVDAWDASFSALVRSKGRGDHPFVSIPAFPNRKFRLSYIYVNSSAEIDQPADLEGKRVFVSSTAGVWARGALQHHYDVDLARIHWVMPEAEAMSWTPGVQVEVLPRGADLDALLLARELDAVIEPNVLPSITRRDPRVRRLFPDYKTEEQNYYRRTGIFPISHVVTLTREFVDHHPDAPVALLRAYREARDIAFRRIEGSDPEYVTISWASAAMDEQRRLMGENYWAYNVEENRCSLEAMMQYSHELGLTPTKLDYESFFDPRAAALPGA